MPRHLLRYSHVSSHYRPRVALQTICCMHSANEEKGHLHCWQLSKCLKLSFTLVQSTIYPFNRTYLFAQYTSLPKAIHRSRKLISYDIFPVNCKLNKLIYPSHIKFWQSLGVSLPETQSLFIGKLCKSVSFAKNPHISALCLCVFFS